MAGHSKWANIRHRKAAQDKKRGKLFTRLIRELTVAARSGAEPEENPRLRQALERAATVNIPRDTINRAIARGSGKSSADSMEETSYEGYGPCGVAIFVEAVTDNRNRTVAEVRHAFARFGGKLGTDGSVAYLFKRCGDIALESGQNSEQIVDIAASLNAEDIIEEEGVPLRVITTAEHLYETSNAFDKHSIAVAHAQLSMVAQSTVELNNQDDLRQLMRLLDALDELDDVCEVYHNAKFSDALWRTAEASVAGA